MEPVQTNEYSKPEENSSSFWKRLYMYQKERFPVLGHGVMIAAFSFSAISYSRICRGEQGFVSWPVYFVGILITITLFFLVRIFDEFKDAEDDAAYRKHLPVPRGLIRFSELKKMTIAILILQVSINLLFFPIMLIMYAVIIVYLLLMAKEFFIAEWLKKHQFWYVTSHMLIIPLIDMYASGLDWILAGAAAPKGLLFFYAVSYMNGIVLEIGRKIRTPEKESTGVLTYSSMLGPAKAVRLWLLMLCITCCLSIAAAQFVGYGTMAIGILGSMFIICSVPAILFIAKKTERTAKAIELSSALWTIAMYLSLGGIPMLQKMIF